MPELWKIIETLLLDNGIEFSKIEEMMTSVKDKEKISSIFHTSICII